MSTSPIHNTSETQIQPGEELRKQAKDALLEAAIVMANEAKKRAEANLAGSTELSNAAADLYRAAIYGR